MEGWEPREYVVNLEEARAAYERTHGWKKDLLIEAELAELRARRVRAAAEALLAPRRWPATA
jgi:hypothetical protein